jgi:peptidylprolyl isomerase
MRVGRVRTISAILTTTAVLISVTGCSSARPSSPGTAAAPGARSVAGVSEKAPIDLRSKPVISVAPTGTPESLQVADVVTGTGTAATPTSTVSVQYLGLSYADGKEFDSSWSRGGQPAGFSLTQVVPGFTQGIGGNGAVAPMKVGGRRIIVVPSAMGYGTDGNPPVIQPNEPLIFVVDLLSVS